MIKVGITGGIGSGKTTVCRIFESLGIPVYYADDRAKTLMQTDPDLVVAIKQQFGETIYNTSGTLNKEKLASIVFHNKKKLAKLNALVHPAVLNDSNRWAHEQKGVPYVLKEAALLFESGSYTHLDRIITVSAPESIRLQRIMIRDGSSREEIMARMANQWPEKEKTEMSDWVIANDGTQLVIPQVLNIHQVLLSDQ